MASRESGDQAPAWLVGETLAMVAAGAGMVWLLAQIPPPVVIRRAVAAPGEAISPPPPDHAEWPRVSVIVPARDEERNLPQLLPSLIQQAYPAGRFEVIAVDDQSTDHTSEILANVAARSPVLRVVRGQPLPAGWKGKPWAMQQGAAVATGEWLLFTDADTVHAHTSLASTVYDAVARGVDLYTIAPHLVLRGPAERLIMPVVSLGIAILYPPLAVNNPNFPIAIANGQFLLIRRLVWDAIGGVAAVRNDIAEDLELGRLVKRRGHRLYIADGDQVMRVRMYHNFAEIWAGWRKNVLLSFKKVPASGVASLVGVVGVLTPFVLLARYAGRLARHGRRADAQSAALAALQVALLLLAKRQVDRRLGLPIGWMFALPAGMVLFAGILLDSLRRLLSGAGVTWKGRAYTS